MAIIDIPDDDTGQAIERWAVGGSDLTKPMKIDFFVVVDTEAAGSNVASDADLAAFATSVEQDDASGAWTCYCTRTMIPDYQAIVGVENLISNVARRHGAAYDGFGSFGNATS